MLLAWLVACGDACKDCDSGSFTPAPDPPLLICSDLGFETAEEPLRAFCVGCAELSCSWQVMVDTEVVDRVELDVRGSAPDGSDWSEYHDTFVAGDEGLYTLSLTRVGSKDDYESGVTTLFEGDADGVSWLFSAADVEQVYVDCARHGPDTEAWEDCRDLDGG